MEEVSVGEGFVEFGEEGGDMERGSWEVEDGCGLTGCLTLLVLTL